jgi:hypothetical protein
VSSLPSSLLRAAVALATMVALVVPGAAFAQLRVSIGAGAGIAGSTMGSLSEGLTAPVVMGEVAAMAKAVGVGVEVDGWRHDSLSILIASGDLHVRLASTPLAIKLGAGVGRGDPDGQGTISGTAGHIGATYDFGFSATRALTLFANGLVVYTSARSLQMVDAGLAITWR